MIDRSGSRAAAVIRNQNDVRTLLWGPDAGSLLAAAVEQWRLDGCLGIDRLRLTVDHPAGDRARIRHSWEPRAVT